ncbi:hypothetical protein CPAR01_09486 [Colletotrichum paranaense]|uniref:Stress-induced bacterial acidophilic repeat domain-containing protein n=1 Tax=Colletotrichum paranaense TaxID=1914294 RepID=A0ABQ9SGV6_9PEZI|nr:uncharacterized protein CPAR01_09486 [Colletotrichum paranaense]KAK1535944.1 hypothetical protein CPAR01_09486 [Colletotrichum paranaense]
MVKEKMTPEAAARIKAGNKDKKFVQKTAAAAQRNYPNHPTYKSSGGSGGGSSSSGGQSGGGSGGSSGGGSK